MSIRPALTSPTPVAFTYSSFIYLLIHSSSRNLISCSLDSSYFQSIHQFRMLSLPSRLVKTCVVPIRLTCNASQASPPQNESFPSSDAMQRDREGIRVQVASIQSPSLPPQTSTCVLLPRWWSWCRCCCRCWCWCCRILPFRLSSSSVMPVRLACE